MRLLLDTHAFLWWVVADPKLSRRTRSAIADDEQNDLFVSAASASDIPIKCRTEKLADAGSAANHVAAATASEGFGELPISLRHDQRAVDLAGLHKDPFDRMLIAQWLAENMTLVSNERAFDAYAVKRLW